MMDGCCSAASPCAHQKVDPSSLCAVCDEVRKNELRNDILAKAQPIRRTQEFWDRYFLTVAKAVSEASKDPSTKVGAVIVRQDKTMASFGYNGFPRGIADTEARLNNREVKYDLVVHGEINAILSAREPLHGYTLYTWPFFTCKRCALHVIQAGIKRAVAPALPPELVERWKSSLEDAAAIYDEAGVDYSFIEGEI